MRARETATAPLVVWLHCARRATGTGHSGRPIATGNSRAKHQTISSACVGRGLSRGLNALRWQHAITRTRTSGDRAVCLGRRGSSLELRNCSRKPRRNRLVTTNNREEATGDSPDEPRGRRAAAVSAGMYSNTPHRAGSKLKARQMRRCVRTSPRCRCCSNPRTGMFGGWVSHAERAAAHHSRGQSAAAGRGFAAAERPAGPMAVVCCVVGGVGQAKETVPLPCPTPTSLLRSVSMRPGGVVRLWIVAPD